MHRRYIHASILLFTAVVFMAVPRSPGYTNPLDGGVNQTVTNNWTVQDGDLYVGQTTPGNELVIEHGLVQNSHGYVGSHAGSDSNSVSVVGRESIWHNSEALYLGGHREGTSWVDGGIGNELFIYSFDGMVLVGEMDTAVVNPRITDIVIGDASGTPEMVVANGSKVLGYYNAYVGYGTNESGSVDIRGEGSVWTAGYSGAETFYLYVGWDGSGNTLTVSDGGLLDADVAVIGYGAHSSHNLVRVTGTGSRWDGSPIVGRFGSGNRLEVSAGGLLNSRGGFLGMETGSDQNSALVTGAGSAWKTSNSIQVGLRGKENTLTISDGGLVSNETLDDYTKLIVGGETGGDNNAVIVTGAGSVLTGFQAVLLGHEWSWLDFTHPSHTAGRGNALYVSDGGLVSASVDLYSLNHSTVAVDDARSQILVGGVADPLVVPATYYQDATSVLRVGITSNRSDTAFLSVQGSAAFEAGATLQYHSVQAGFLDFDHFSTNLLVEADTLIVAGVTNATDLGDLEVVNLDSSLVDMVLWGQDQNMYGLLSRRHLAESAGFVPGSQMASVSGEIDDLSVLGNQMAVEQINQLNRMSGSEQNAQLTQRYAQGSPNYRHNQTLIGGRNQVLSQSKAFQSSARSSASAPSGPAGPHKEGQELRGWIQGYGGWSDYDGTPSFSGFDQSIYGTIIGFDQAFGNVLLGAAGGYAQSDLTQDNQDSSDATTGYGVVYASLGTTDWFGDLLVSYGQSQVETQSGTLLGGSGNFTAANFAFYMGGGKEIRSSGHDGLAFIPEAALSAGFYGQPAYTDGLMQVDAYDYWSVQSRIGAALRMERKLGSVRMTPEFRTYWLHEFNTDPDQIGYSLTGGSGSYSFGVQAPVEDLLEIGLGLSLAFTDRFELVFDVDAQTSELYKALNASGRVSYEF